ncbi:LAETG motif-containing sortase-dependent surface protein [Streptomyces sp. NPDC002889]|uniref:LAETG motif-containing sortase-dependent surface protein n=1 Tax=Streptomyces sp. NPDC002889 TaxID=3364669 RepID=UPI00367958B7
MVGALGVGLAAGPAVAHTPTWEVDCDAVVLNLTNYGRDSQNTVTVTVDGKDLLPTETFANDFKKTLKLPAHDAEVSVRLVLKASDGDQHSRDETKTAPVCEESPNPSTTPSPSQSPTPSETPGTATPTPSTSTSSAPVKPSAAPSTETPDLAETGSSSSTPLIAGAAAVVLVAGGGIMWAARKRRSVQS